MVTGSFLRVVRLNFDIGGLVQPGKKAKSIAFSPSLFSGGVQ